MNITAKDIRKAYNKKVVLNIDEIKIASGEVFGLVGNNGAGKTTFIRLLLDLIAPNKGQIEINNKAVNKYEEWKEATGSFVDDSFLIPFLSAKEYFDIIADAYQISETEMKERFQEYSDFFDEDILRQNKLLRNYSQGNKRKIGIVAALIVNPKLLVLDEPFANLDPSSQSKLIKLLLHIRETQKPTMFISSHNLEHITKVCQRIAIIEKGQIIKDYQINQETTKDIKAYFSI